MTAASTSSDAPAPRTRGRVAADYIYQGATILAALLIALSAAV